MTGGDLVNDRVVQWGCLIMLNPSTFRDHGGDGDGDEDGDGDGDDDRGGNGIGDGDGDADTSNEFPNPRLH